MTIDSYIESYMKIIVQWMKEVYEIVQKVQKLDVALQGMRQEVASEDEQSIEHCSLDMRMCRA